VAEPKGVAEWLAVARDFEAAAAAKHCDDKDTAKFGYDFSGLAIEAALKAYIWHIERPNENPSRDRFPAWYNHNIRALMRRAGIVISPKDPDAKSWQAALQWRHGQYYEPSRMQRKIAKSMQEAAFGSNGVVTWIRKNLA
jgi:hypothetical protein